MLKNPYNCPDQTFCEKLVVIGDSDVGKTSLINSLISSKNEEDQYVNSITLN